MDTSYLADAGYLLASLLVALVFMITASYEALLTKLKLIIAGAYDNVPWKCYGLIPRHPFLATINIYKQL